MATFSFGKLNKEKLFNIDTKNFDYKSLEELYKEQGVEPTTGEIIDNVYVVRGVYINTKSLYDPAPVVALDDCYVNLPAHMTPDCEAMLNDQRAIVAINQGKCGFRIYKYHMDKYNKDCYSVEWVDM